jgi:hypothetical protein
MALPFLGSMRGYRLKMRKRNDRRGGSRRVGRVGGGRPERAHASAVWHSAVIGKRPVGVSYF